MNQEKDKRQTPLRCLLRLWILILIASFSSSDTFAYDVYSRTTAGYDDNAKSGSVYDAGVGLTTGEKKPGVTEEHDLSAKFAEFLAAEGTEIIYRTMSQANYDTLLATGKLPATSETFISPSLQYASKYNGVTVQFKVQAGSTESLMGIGVRNSASGFAGTAYEGVPIVNGSWTANSAFFKWEQGVLNVGLAAC
jgi:hypothetical protein